RPRYASSGCARSRRTKTRKSSHETQAAHPRDARAPAQPRTPRCATHPTVRLETKQARSRRAADQHTRCACVSHTRPRLPCCRFSVGGNQTNRRTHLKPRTRRQRTRGLHGGSKKELIMKRDDIFPSKYLKSR